MSRISMDEQMMQGEIDRLQSELDHTQESIRAWTEKHAGQLNHSDIVYLMTLAGMKIL
jgi:hypothetical protein